VAFTALFDACVLYPAPLRDLLIELACTNLFRTRWTDRIQEEWIINLHANRPELTLERLRRTAGLMNEAVEDCLVTDYEGLIPSLTLPDENDRHVLAAAIVGRADVIVTANLKDFPASVLTPYGIKAQHPDAFIRHALDLDRHALTAVRTVRLGLKRPPKSVDEYLASLLQQGLPETVSFLRDWTCVL